MTTPNGYPIWSRTSDFTVYGGATDKANYQSQGAVNPRTDITAEQFMRLVEDVAECARTAAFCQMSITCNDATSAHPTVNWVRMGTGVRSTSYTGNAPPAGFPTAERISDGCVRVTFDAEYADAYGVTADFTPTHVVSAPASAGCAYVSWVISSGDLVLRAYDSTGTADADSTFTVEVA